MSENWVQVPLGGGVEALSKWIEINALWTAAYIAAGQPKEMAVFSHKEPGVDVITAYFSPAAASLARSMPGARACAQPGYENLGLQVGDQRAWDIYFPKRSRPRAR